MIHLPSAFGLLACQILAAWRPPGFDTLPVSLILAWLGLLGLPCLGLAWLASQPGLSLPTATTTAARSAAPPAEGGRVVVAVGKDEPG